MALISPEQKVWNKFSEESRREMIEDDRVAWNRVCSLLVLIVSCGLLLAVTTVIICSR